MLLLKTLIAFNGNSIWFDMYSKNQMRGENQSNSKKIDTLNADTWLKRVSDAAAA